MSCFVVKSRQFSHLQHPQFEECPFYRGLLINLKLNSKFYGNTTDIMDKNALFVRIAYNGLNPVI
ncbi:MAG: hypothetical protein EAY81_02785 [Bacteroidetes bacterium]|nr:MAG: hypothetical protein EAY81_02785 [Bacteroidota bacterium]